MIELIDRQEILKLNNTFTSFVLRWQHDRYNPFAEGNSYEPGIMIDDNDIKRYCSQEECDQWNNERLEKFNRKRDKIEFVSEEDKYEGKAIYNFPAAHINDYIQNLSRGIVKLNSELKWGSVIFLLDYPEPWLSQKNTFKPVKKAMNYLRSIGVTDDFVGGFKANDEDLKKLLENLFWIFRCNASLAYCWLSATNKKFVCQICQYGKLHFFFYSRQQKINIQRKAKEMGMTKIDNCSEDFSETGAIEGRQMKLD